MTFERGNIIIIMTWKSQKPKVFIFIRKNLKMMVKICQESITRGVQLACLGHGTFTDRSIFRLCGGNQVSSGLHECASARKKMAYLTTG